VKKALAVADRGYVLERGALVASGPAPLLARSAVVREAYLGAAGEGVHTAAEAARKHRVPLGIAG
jgi:branched-chain amino acid transport system ATP-binding protein